VFPRKPGVLAAAAVAASALLLAGCGSDPPAPEPAAPALSVTGHLAFWDEPAGVRAVRAQVEQLDAVSPWWYAVDDAGSVYYQGPEGEPDPSLVGELQRLGLAVTATVANVRGSQWDRSLVAGLLADPARRAEHAGALVDLVETGGFDGLTLDYEELRGEDRAGLTALVDELGTALRARGRTLTVAVHAKHDDEGYGERNAAQDYAALGRAADRVLVMGYDWHWQTGDSGPIAPLG
jgi:spore germination protein